MNLGQFGQQWIGWCYLSPRSANRLGGGSGVLCLRGVFEDKAVPMQEGQVARIDFAQAERFIEPELCLAGVDRRMLRRIQCRREPHSP